MRLGKPFMIVMGVLLFASLCRADSKPIKPGIGSIRCEIWHNLEGGQITDTLAAGELPGKPDETMPLDSFELNPAPEEPARLR